MKDMSTVVKLTNLPLTQALRCLALSLFPEHSRSERKWQWYCEMRFCSVARFKALLAPNEPPEWSKGLRSRHRSRSSVKIKEGPILKTLLDSGGASSLTDLASRSPASTAPSMYPLQCVAVSVPAKWILSTGSRIILQGNREVTQLPEKALRMNESIAALIYPREDRVTQIVSKSPMWLSQRWKALPYFLGFHSRV